MSTKQKAFEMDAQGRCIVCGEKSSERRRGLCGKHYEQYRRAKLSVSPEQIEEFEELLVEQGRLMPSVQGKKPGVENVFADIAAAIRLKHAHAAEDPENYNKMPTAADAAEIIADAAKSGGVRKTTARKKKAE